MPAKTATPMACRISEPAPWDLTNGNTPAMKAMLVIKMGRSRSLQASSAASTMPMPSCCFSRANSTMRMAFLHARPTSTIRPIWVKMLLSVPFSITPTIAQSRHIGTIRMMASGRVRLSYCAARTRNTRKRHSGKT